MPSCADYEETLRRTLDLISETQGQWAASALESYLTGDYTGAQFDRLIDSDHPNEFTEADFSAVSKLKVSVVRQAKAWLTGPGRNEVMECLTAIPTDLDLWDIDDDGYDAILGRGSPAWRIWTLISDHQENAGHAGKGVTAGKLLHGKRPRLIPIFDDRAVKPVLNVSSSNIWEAYWCTLRHPEVRDRLRAIQAAVPAAAHLSTLRVLDIVVWMSIQE